MSILPLDSTLHRGLLGDPEIAVLMDERAEIAAMIRVEIALAQAQAKIGMIPQFAAAAISTGLSEVAIAPEEPAAGVCRDGVIAPALVAALRKRLPADAAPWLHWGATSQDIADTALILRLGSALAVLETRLDALLAALVALSRAHRETVCLARTRMQAAAPTLFGLRVAHWFAPLIGIREQLHLLRPRLLTVQLGGATGDLSVFGTAGLPLIRQFAEELELGQALPWHTDRTRLNEFAACLALMANATGKIGADLALMAQNEIGEVRFAGAGGSSTLPQKQNPVKAEVLQTLARYAAQLAGGMLGTGVHINERDGTSWTLEWLLLPQLVVTAGASLMRANEAIEAVRPDVARMRANIDATNGLALAEAAGFALAAHMPRDEASAHVKDAVAASLATGHHLLDILAARLHAPIDWSPLREPLSALAAAGLLTDELIANAENALRSG
jgi:3-carboxy-cis,cis-muconate cycloisomerase